MPGPEEYCFWCMSKLPSPNGVCKVCGKNNEHRENGAGELPFALLAGKYLVGHALGRGGFGITYIGMNIMLEKRVAIKEYFPEEIARRSADRIHVEANAPEVAEQYENGKRQALEEARTIARVQSIPNVVGIYDCFGRNNTVYIIMEFIDGESFSDYAARKGPVSWSKIWPMIRPVGIALEKLHRLGLVHRDVSPDNIMVRRDDGSCVLLDFGAASTAAAEGKAHTTAIKDGYAAIEQYRHGMDINGRTDEYAWCATLWYMLTGVKPPPAPQRASLGTKLAIPPTVRKNFNRNVRDALLKGMSVDQKDRYPDLEQLIRELDAATHKRTGGSAVLWAGLALAGLILLAVVLAGILGMSK